MPKRSDLETLAERIRYYVLNPTQEVTEYKRYSTGEFTPKERKALATLGRRGGKKAQQVRWDKNRDDQHQHRKKALENLEWANEKRSGRALGRTYQITAFIIAERIQHGQMPTRRQIMEKFDISESTAKRHIREAKKLMV